MPKILNISIFLCILVIFLSHYYLSGQAVYGDGIYYFAYDHSLVKNHTLDQRSEMEHRYDHTYNNKPTENATFPLLVSRQKKVYNRYPIGAPLLWITPYYVLDLVGSMISHINPAFPANGYSDIYQIGIGIVNLLFILIGLNIFYAFLKNFFKSTIAMITTLLIFFGTNLLYYGSFDVINSHPSSFLLCSLFFWYWWKTWKNRRLRDWFILGILVGFLGMIRTQDITFLSLLLADLFLYVHRRKVSRLFGLKVLSVLLVGFFIAFLPQMIAWNIMNGSFWVSPYLFGSNSFSPFQPHIFGVLFNTKTGLALWTPLYVLCFFGLILLRRKEKLVSTYAILFSLLQFYVIASWVGWQQGESFGIRMLISSLPVLVLGLGSILSKTKRYIYVILVFFILYNLTAIVEFTLFVHAPTYDGQTIMKIQSIEKLNHLLKRISL